MVTKLTGIIEGNPVIFERKSGDVWEATIPKDLNGYYAVELTAVDDVGNVAYCTKYIVMIDLTKLCVHLEEYPFRTELLLNPYSSRVRVSDFWAELSKKECGGIR